MPLYVNDTFFDIYVLLLIPSLTLPHKNSEKKKNIPKNKHKFTQQQPKDYKNDHKFSNDLIHIFISQYILFHKSTANHATINMFKKYNNHDHIIIKHMLRLKKSKTKAKY